MGAYGTNGIKKVKVMLNIDIESFKKPRNI